jgi:hypothetical protein
MDQPSQQARTPAPWLAAVALAAVLLGCSLLFFHGKLETSDEVQLVLTSHAIWDRGSLEFDREVNGLRSSGYSLGLPLLGLPLLAIERLLGMLPDGIHTILPLLNSILFAVLGLLASCCLEGSRRWGGVALALILSPFLPLSLTFYSEMLAGVGLAIMAVAGFRGAPTPIAFAGALTAMLARPAMLPFVGLVGLWIGMERRDWRPVAAAAAGALLGIAASLWQNWVLRGGFLNSGYKDLAFSTPLGTGLYGLLFSSERGILLFWPLVLGPLLWWSTMPARVQRLTILGAGVTATSLVLHALFWTWHGGWTNGPRFVLPALVLLLPAMAWGWMHVDLLSPPRRTALLLGAAWSGWMALTYAKHSPHVWWNTLWGFHQQEGQWMFMPQLSLWQAALEGVPLLPAKEMTGLARVGWLMAGLMGIALGFYPLLQGFRLRVGTDPLPLSTPPATSLPELAARYVVLLWLAAALWFSSVLSLLDGPRGWVSDEGPRSHLLHRGTAATYQAVIEQPMGMPIQFAARANAAYRVFINEELMLEGQEPIPQHLPRFEANLPKGLHTIRVEIASKDGTTPPVFELFWTWAGGGRYLAPVGGEYVAPRPLTAWERAVTYFRRRQWIAYAGILALLLLLRGWSAGSTVRRAD